MKVQYQQSRIRKILEKSRDVTSLLIGSTVALASKKDYRHKRQYLTPAKTNITGGGNAMVWSGYPYTGARLFIGKGVNNHTIYIAPDDRRHDMFVAKAYAGSNRNRVTVLPKTHSKRYADWTVKYSVVADARNSYAGSISLNNYNIASNSHPLGYSIDPSKGRTLAYDQNWASAVWTSPTKSMKDETTLLLKVLKMGPALHDAYFQSFVYDTVHEQLNCCMAKHGSITETMCKAGGWNPQGGKCDALMVKRCADSRYKDNPECKCINSPLRDTKIPSGCDTNCTSGTSYTTKSAARSVDAGCKYIDCSVNALLNPSQQASISDVNVTQKCDAQDAALKKKAEDAEAARIAVEDSIKAENAERERIRQESELAKKNEAERARKEQEKLSRAKTLRAIEEAALKAADSAKKTAEIARLSPTETATLVEQAEADARVTTLENRKAVEQLEVDLAGQQAGDAAALDVLEGANTRIQDAGAAAAARSDAGYRKAKEAGEDYAGEYADAPILERLREWAVENADMLLVVFVFLIVVYFITVYKRRSAPLDTQQDMGYPAPYQQTAVAQFFNP